MSGWQAAALVWLVVTLGEVAFYAAVRRRELRAEMPETPLVRRALLIAELAVVAVCWPLFEARFLCDLATGRETLGRRGGGEREW